MFLLLYDFSQFAYSLSVIGFQPNLVRNENGYKANEHFDPKRYVGVTGVKKCQKIVYTENAIPSTCYIAGPRD